MAIACGEPERGAFIARIETSDDVHCSAVTLYETGVVLIQKKIEARVGHAADLAERLGSTIVPFNAEQAKFALDAYRRYGKGLGRRPFLNFGDCVSYALAKSLDAPLLYKGDDFSATDLASAL